MKIINTKNENFKAEFDAILTRANSDIKDVSSIVMNIISEIFLRLRFPKISANGSRLGDVEDF